MSALPSKAESPELLRGLHPLSFAGSAGKFAARVEAAPARRANHRRKMRDLRAYIVCSAVNFRADRVRQNTKFACVFNANTSVQIST
jgi:hypothetical protein